MDQASEIAEWTIGSLDRFEAALVDAKVAFLGL